MVEDARLRDIAASVAPFYARWDDGRLRAVLEEFGLPPEKKFKALSHGMKMKFSLALALAHGADLLVLDEPTSGLDPVYRRELLERLSAVIQDEGKSVLFSTHITSDLEATADFITIHYQLSERSRGLITAADIGRMKKSAYLINTARAPI